MKNALQDMQDVQAEFSGPLLRSYRGSHLRRCGREWCPGLCVYVVTSAS